MKITKIRYPLIEDKDQLVKPGVGYLAALIQEIEHKMSRLGFRVEGSVINSTSVKLGFNKAQFAIDPEIVGYNTRYAPGSNPRRTRTPSWEQRVKFNDVLNEILDSYGISANVSSGPFTIRQGLDTFDENDWEDQVPYYLNHNKALGYYVEQGDYKSKKSVA